MRLWHIRGFRNVFEYFVSQFRFPGACMHAKRKSVYATDKKCCCSSQTANPLLCMHPSKSQMNARLANRIPHGNHMRMCVLHAYHKKSACCRTPPRPTFKVRWLPLPVAPTPKKGNGFGKISWRAIPRTYRFCFRAFFVVE